MNTDLVHMPAIRERRCQALRKAWTQVLVEQQAHGAFLSRQVAFALSGEDQRRLDVFRAQGRKVVENFLLRHSAGELFQNIVDGDARAGDTRFSAADPWCDNDQFLEVHGVLPPSIT